MSDQNILPNQNMSTQDINKDSNLQSRKRKRRVRHLSSSASSSSSTSSSSSSSDSSTNRKRSHRSRKRNKRSQRDRKLEKLFEEVADLKKNIMNRSNEFDSGSLDVCDHDDCLDDNVSRQMYCDNISIDEPDNSELGPEISLSIGTKTKDPDILKTPSAYLDILNSIQRFNDPDWTNVRYSEVQKNYRHTPGFTELDANDELKRYDASRSLINMEKAFGSLTFALIKQKEQLQMELRSFLSWTRQADNLNPDTISEKITNIFVNGEYAKISSDTLQMICGHRAECIQQRRETILAGVKDPLHKTMMRKIPPSCHNLFAAEQLTSTLEKAGGVNKVFWPRDKDRASAPQTDPSTSTAQRKFPLPSQRKVTYKHMGHTSSRPNNKPFFNSGKPFRGRGGKQSNNHRSNDNPNTSRKASPSSHRDRRGNSRRF